VDSLGRGNQGAPENGPRYSVSVYLYCTKLIETMCSLYDSEEHAASGPVDFVHDVQTAYVVDMNSYFTERNEFIYRSQDIYSSLKGKLLRKSKSPPKSVSSS
jgi:hypothetical protein